MSAVGAAEFAHIGPLATHDLWLVIPMAVLSALIIVVMVRPRPAPPAPDDRAPDDQPGAGDQRRPGGGPTGGGYR